MQKKSPVICVTLAAIILATAFASGYAKTASVAKSADKPGDPLKAVTGFWYTEGHEGGVELYPCGNGVCGRLHWLSDVDEGEIPRDTRNPNPDLRDKPLCNLKFIGGFTPTDDNHYTNGWIYSPRHGAEFSAHMTLIDHNTLKLRGYLFFPALGQSQIWKRDDSMPGCKTP